MKKLLFGLAMIGLFTSCDSDTGSTTDGNSRAANEVRLSASVANSLQQRAPIDNTFTTDFPIGIYAYNGAWKAGCTANEINNDAATVSGLGAHPIGFGSGPYYYPADGTDLNFFAFAPRGTESTPAGAGTSPSVTMSITGQEDVMWASAIGNKVGSAPAVNPVLNFAHKLTQLQFTFVQGSTYSSGNSVVSLLVKSQPTTVNMNVGSGVCTFSGSADMQALSSANQTAGITIAPTPGNNANSPVMTSVAASPATTTTYLMDIVVKPAGGGSNVTYSGVSVTLSAVVGSAHMITLTFQQTAVTATATVAAWATGTGGSVTVL